MNDDRIIERQHLVKGKVFDVDHLKLRMSDGGIAERDVVMHNGAVVVLPVLSDSQIVLIRNQRFAVGEELWELCAGTLEPGENAADCAGRELIEETGYRADRVTPACGFYSCPGFCTEFLHGFIAEGLTEVGQALEATEKIMPHTVEISEALTMIRDGRIKDAKTIALLLYWHTFLE